MITDLLCIINMVSGGMFPCHSMQKVTVMETGCGSFEKDQPLVFLKTPRTCGFHDFWFLHCCAVTGEAPVLCGDE